VEPQPGALEHLRDVPVEKLRHLRCLDVGLAQHGRDGRDGRYALAQCSGQLVFGTLLGVSGGSGFFSTQALQSVTPRNVQMMQMNVPQLEHG
jgi:hypothetical protein